MLDNLLLLLNYIRDNFSFIITLKFFSLIVILNRLHTLSYYILENFYYKDLLKIYSHFYLILPRFIILNFSSISLSYGISLIFGGLANSNYCFIHMFVIVLLFLFNLIILWYLYKKVNLLNFIIILNFILFLLLFLNISFLFEFIYGVNPIPNLSDVLSFPEYSDLEPYDKYKLFWKLYFEDVDYNNKHPGVLQKFI